MKNQFVPEENWKTNDENKSKDASTDDFNGVNGDLQPRINKFP